MYYNGDGTVQAEYLYVYSADGQLAKQYAISSGNVVEEYSFEYDSLGRLIRSREDKGSSNVQRTEHLYDTANRLTKQSWTIGGKAFTESYTYNSGDGSLNTFTTALYGHTQTFTYDSLKRVSRASIKKPSGTELFYTVNNYAAYTGNANRTTNRVSSFSYRKTNADLIAGNSYTYDASGNITRITDLGTNKTVAAYEYDAQGQLTKETRYVGSKTTTVTYDYDTAGNILSKVSSDTGTASYSYNNSHWQDLLTAYKGNSIYYEGQKTASGSYSASTKPLSGNPITWYNGSSYTDLTWAQGRRLMSLKKGSTAVSYTYDMEGIRSSKTVNGVTHHYVTQNGRVVRESYGNTILDFIYDANGNPFALSFSKNGGSGFEAFYYLLNAQGDVIGLINGSGELVVSYTYDAWGNILSMECYNLLYKNLHEMNPLRYRGYYYDAETGWYYLQSRYYDPEIGRFINLDSQVSASDAVGMNLFAYCFNNPVNWRDSSGSWPDWLTGVMNVVGGALQMVAGAALGAATSWTGVGAVAAGVLFINGAATMIQGTGQIVNSVTQTNIMPEDNFARSTAQSAGRAIGGESGAAVAGALYDTAVMTASVYSFAYSITNSTSAYSGNYCFVAGTVVLTSVGYKTIEDVRPGDKVWSCNPETGVKALKEVVQTFINEADELIHVYVNGEEIITTPEHPFYVSEKGWTEAVRLCAGDVLITKNSEFVIVEGIQHELLELPVKVYNFEVEDFHTYYVGQVAMLVHNACRPTSPNKLNKSAIRNVDMHGFKEGFVGDSKAQWDVFKDTANDGMLWLGNKSQTEWIETGFTLEQLIELYPKGE